MSDNGTVTADTIGHILHITVDRQDKMNGFTPEMFTELSTHMTTLDEDPELWVGVVTCKALTAVIMLSGSYLCMCVTYPICDQPQENDP